MLQEINKQILINLNSLLDINFIKNFVLVFADTPIFFLPIFLLGMWIFHTYNKNNIENNLNNKDRLLYIFYGVILGIIINIFIQNLVHIDRPEEAIKGVGTLLLEHIPDASFPSDHATVSVAFLTGLFFAGYKKTGLIFSFFVISMLISRIIVGVHWPLDIAVGIIIGVASSSFVFTYLSKIEFTKKLNSFIIKTLNYIKL